MRINLNLKQKFNLLLAVVFLGGVYLSGLALSQILYQQAEVKLTDEGQILMRMMEEVKYYTSDHLLEFYQQKNNLTEDFRVSIVPAYAARKIFDNFKSMSDFKNYQYKEATQNPTNPEDAPSTFETKLLDAFKENRNLAVLSGYVNNQRNYYYISRPLSVKDKSCLQCHSTPDIAPPKMVEIYGAENGFNWKLNQLTSAQTIYIPADNIALDVRRGMLLFMPMFAGVFAILILAMNRLLQHTVIKPLKRLTQAANGLSMDHPLPQIREHLGFLDRLQQRGDEPGKLTRAFLLMAKQIASREQDLQQAVADSTKELRAEIKERTIIEQKLARQIQRALLQEKITQEIRQSLDASQILQAAVNNVGQALGVSRCQIFSYISCQPRQAQIVAEYIVPPYPKTLGMNISLDEAICLDKAMSREKAMFCSFVYDDPLLQPCVHIYRQLQINSLLTVRTSYQGQVNGAISIQQCDRYRQWQSDEVKLMESVAAQVGIALAQAKLFQREKQRRQEIAIAKQAAEVASQTKTQFLANISHELRTPLNAIIGFSQLMNRDPGIKPQQQESLNIINRSGEHLLDMINEVLEMSKIEAGQVELNLSTIDLKQLLSTLEAMLGIKARAKNLSLFIECAPDIPDHIQTDESKLRQILINLLGNAIKFTHTGQVKLQVYLAPESDSQVNLELDSPCTLHFDVIDTGSGIAPEEISQIFQAFTQSETGRQSKQGTGLGLPISKKYVELLGGSLGVVSQVDHGSTFSFTIKTKLGHFSSSESTNLTQVKSLMPEQSTFRILVVDDVWQSRLLILKLLSQIGFAVQEAADGQQAIELTQKWQPHLILMDMRMPLMDGYEATRIIRNMSAIGFNSDCAVKILALTASAFMSKRSATLEAGCDDYLRKPFREHELLAKIQKLLGVKYLYQNQGDVLNAKLLLPEQPLNSPPKLTSEALKQMPPVWLQELKSAASALDETKLLELINQIPAEQQPLAQGLTNLVDNFQFEQIFALVSALV